MVIAEFHASLAFVGHMTIGARHSALGMNSHLRNLVIRMLCFQYTGFAQCMCIIGKVGLVIVGFHIFYRKSFIPRESQVFAISLEIIFHVALCAYQRTHFLRSRFIDIFPLTGKCLAQSRTANMKFHIRRFMTIGATYRIDDLTTESSPLIIIERIHSNSFHHARNVRTLTSPAGRRLRPAFIIHRRTGTE